MYGYFKRQADEITHGKTWTWAQKRHLKKETELNLMPGQNNVIRTNYIQSKIDYSQKNGKIRLCGEKDKTVNHTKTDTVS